MDLEDILGRQIERNLEPLGKYLEGDSIWGELKTGDDSSPIKLKYCRDIRDSSGKLIKSAVAMVRFELVVRYKVRKVYLLESGTDYFVEGTSETLLDNVRIHVCKGIFDRTEQLQKQSYILPLYKKIGTDRMIIGDVHYAKR